MFHRDKPTTDKPPLQFLRMPVDKITVLTSNKGDKILFSSFSNIDPVVFQVICPANEGQKFVESTLNLRVDEIHKVHAI